MEKSMKLIDNDFAVLLALLLAVGLDLMNKYATFVVAVVAILVGIVKLITLIQTYQNNKLERKIKQRQLDDLPPKKDDNFSLSKGRQ